MSCLPCVRSSVSTPICLHFFITRDVHGCLKVPTHPAGRVVHEARLFTRALHAPVAATTGSTSVSATSVQASSAGTTQFKSPPLGPAVVHLPEIDSRLSGLGATMRNKTAALVVPSTAAARVRLALDLPPVRPPPASICNWSRVLTDRTLDLLQVLGLVRATSLAGKPLYYEVVALTTIRISRMHWLLLGSHAQ